MSDTTQRGTIAIPQQDLHMPPTEHDVLDRDLKTLAGRRKAWVDTSIEARIALLDEMIEDTRLVAAEWAEVGAEAKGIAPTSPHRGEDWLSGPALVVRNLRLLRDTLQDILEHGAPKPPGEPYTRANGQVAVPVFPTSGYDKLLYSGFTGEVWMQEGVTLDNLHEHMARIYQPGNKDEGGVALVLGAGNVSAIGPTNVLYKTFVEDRVCMLKMNPVNEHLGPYMERAFHALVREDVLRVVYGGVDEGVYLTNHDLVDEIHITGSDKTHDAIVFGPGDEGRERRDRNEPLLDKEITSELGNVTPVIIVPGPWSAKDLDYHGLNIASKLVQNAGFNCIAARVVIQHKRWRKRRALLDAIRDSLAQAEPRDPYYPGAYDRWKRFTEEHPEAEWYGQTGEGCVPWTLIPDLDPSEADDIAFTTEAFTGVFAETALDAPESVPAYIDQAVEFCNDRLWGTLSASIIVHPASLEDPATAAALERALENLRYGTVVVNHWSAVPYAMASPTWGAYPGHTIDDIQSGRGVVHNTYLLEHPEKSVVRGPFRLPVAPPWFHSHRRLKEVGQVMVDFEATQDPKLLPRLLWNLMRA